MPVTTRSMESDGSSVEDPAIPETWQGVRQLPPFPRAERCALCVQYIVGTMIVGLLITFFVGLTWAVTAFKETTGSSVCRALIILEAVIAIGSLWTLQFVPIKVVRRSPEVSFPFPPILAERLRRERMSLLSRPDNASPPGLLDAAAWNRATSGLGNVQDEQRGVYCIRCFVWREEDGHHCSECQRCYNDFDHHCAVLGCCVHGRVWPPTGNMWLFTLLITMAACGLATTVATPILLYTSVGDYWHLVLLALLALFALGYFGYLGFMWFFYDRHAHRRVNKRSA